MESIERVRASAVCVQDARVLCVALRDPSTRISRLFVPGGAIEPGETAAQAAVRETLEETGYHIQVWPEREHVAAYDFTWNGQVFAVRTHFFPAGLRDPARIPERVTDASYHEGVHWIALDAIEAAFDFDRHILAAVRRCL